MERKRMEEIGFERRALFFVLSSCSGIVIGNLLWAITRRYFPTLPEGAWAITFGALALAAVASIKATRVIARLPGRLDGTMRAHPWRAVAFGFCALLAIIQIARITVHTVDQESPWWILTANPFWTQHECGTAYFHAVELHERGETNIYHADHYPVLNRDMEPQTAIQEMKVEDAYQYPPQFLLLPKLLLSITDHYPTLRIIWFTLQILIVSAALFLLSRFVGGERGRWMAMLVPLVVAAPAALYAYQYSQFHLISIALAVMGMLAFEGKWNALGGALLASAILGKIFPVFLLVLLAAERRWKALAWTLAFGAIITIVTLGVLGTAPFTAFFNYHLPRLHSFAAFAFLDVWPEVRFELLTANLSPHGQVMKLAEMGIPGMTQEVATAANTVGMIALVGMGVYAAKRLDTKVRRAQAWLSMIGLASLLSPAAWGDYVPWPALWLLSILAVDVLANRWRAVVISVCGIFFYFLIGLVPLGIFPPPQITYTLSTIFFALMVGLMSWTLVRRVSWAGQEREQRGSAYRVDEQSAFSH